jgi:mannosyltransferase
VLPESERAVPLRAPDTADAEQVATPRSAGGRRGATVVVLLALLAGAVLRFLAPQALWLDESQSVAISRLPLGDLFQALREDGSPPLYYLLLHVWMSVFGSGAFAVRALSGLCSLLALPLAWVLGRRLGGRRMAVMLTLLLASSPFAIRYGSETRMYSFIVLLVLLGACAVGWTARRGGPWPVLAVGASGGALLLTHYWAVYLLAVVGLGCLVTFRRYRAAAVRVLLGLVLSALLFLPWVPSFRWQLAHTGTPWANPGGFSSITTALGAWAGGPHIGAALLGYGFVFLAVLALVGVPDGAVVRLGLTRDPRRWTLVALSFGTLVVAALASLVTSSAVQARYTSVALPAFLALVACGIAVVPSRRTRVAVLALSVVTGLALGAQQGPAERTQAAEVAAALQGANPGDTVVFCPDQLGPGVSRLAPPGLRLVVYPDLAPADRVDWTDYAQRNEAVSPAVVAARLSAQAGAHAIYVVTGRGYTVPSDETCAQFRDDLAGLRGQPRLLVQRKPGVLEQDVLHRFPPTGPPAGQ